LDFNLEAVAAADGLAMTPANRDRLAKVYGDEVARWALAQVELRQRARAKFQNADTMLFEREALEQATHEAVAAYHASLFPFGVPVVDLTVGIGADLIALSRRGPTTGYELDPDRAAVARFNVPGVVILEGDAMDADWGEYAFADPARRVQGRRTLTLAEFSPDPREIAARFSELTLGVQKLTPMLRDEELADLGPEVRFISYGGECREALVLAGAEAGEGAFAAHVESGELLPEGEAGEPTPEADAFFFDADPAVVRAHAIGSLESTFGLTGLGDAPGYLTGPDEVRSPWLRTYRVEYAGPGDARTTRRALQTLCARVFEVKQRGVKLDPAKVRRELNTDGRPVSLVLYPVGKSVRHLLVSAA